MNLLVRFKWYTLDNFPFVKTSRRGTVLGQSESMASWLFICVVSLSAICSVAAFILAPASESLVAASTCIFAMMDNEVKRNIQDEPSSGHHYCQLLYLSVASCRQHRWAYRIRPFGHISTFYTQFNKVFTYYQHTGIGVNPLLVYITSFWLNIIENTLNMVLTEFIAHKKRKLCHY